MTEIRQAVSADRDGLVELVRRFYAVDGRAFDPSQVGSALDTLLESPRFGVVLVVGDIGHPVAYAIVTWGFALESGGIDALLDELYVDRPGHGVGSALLERAMALAVEQGASRMYLETRAHNRRARMFYTQHGFETGDSVWMSRDL